MSKSPIVPGKPGIGGGAPIYPVYPPGGLPSGPLLVSVADATVVGESFSSLLSLRLTTADTITLTDSPNAFRTPLFLSASEATTVSEATALLLITPGTINRLDQVSVTDNPTLFITILKVVAADAATVSESQTFTIISPIALTTADVASMTDSIILRVAAPDLPPGPVITTEPGAILCLCEKAIAVTTIDAFPFAATIVGACKLAAVHIEIVLPNLDGNCSGPVFQNPMPPIVGAPGAWAVRVDETITIAEVITDTIVNVAHGCPCVPADYVVAESVADDFERASGPDFQSALWTSITFDPIFANGGVLGPNNSWPCITTIRILNGALENHRPKNEVGIINDGSISIGGFRNDIGPAPNWLVRAVWADDAKNTEASPNKWYLMAPISFNAGPPYDSLMVSCFAFYAQHTSDGIHPEDGYYFGLVEITAGGISSFISPKVHRLAADWGGGHSYALKVVCNELSPTPGVFNVNDCATIQGLVDDVVVVEAKASLGQITSKLTGYPGVGLDNDYATNIATVATVYTDNFAALASWTADRLV